MNDLIYSALYLIIMFDCVIGLIVLILVMVKLIKNS